MKKSWVEKKNNELFEWYISQKEYVKNEIETSKFIPDDKRKEFIEEYEKENYYLLNIEFELVHLRYIHKFKNLSKEELFTKINECKEWCKSLELRRMENIKNSIKYNGTVKLYDRYLDSDEIEFDGDVIITDPCYIMKKHDDSTQPKWNDFFDRNSYAGMSEEELREVGFHEKHEAYRKAYDEWDENNPEDWDVSEYGDRLDLLGFSNFIARDTLYGDWSCTTFDSDLKKPIGEFCADSGRVCVLPLEEVLKYNPNFNYHTEKPWTTTLIKDFKGKIQYKVKRGKRDFTAYVEGHGINKETGEKINFKTRQTGL